MTQREEKKNVSCLNQFEMINLAWFMVRRGCKEIKMGQGKGMGMGMEMVMRMGTGTWKSVKVKKEIWKSREKTQRGACLATV